LETAYRSHADQIVRYYLHRGVANRSDAEEFAQATFEVAWRYIVDMPEEPLTIIWLYRISRRQISNHWRSTDRSRKLTTRIADDFLISMYLMKEDEPDERAMRIAFAAVRCLQAREAEAFRLVHWDGLSRTEAAAVMGCSTNALNLLLFRARRRLEKEVRRLVTGESSD
jgi:RNA polymerase sigma-70 factor, ECF subfamily